MTMIIFIIIIILIGGSDCDCDDRVTLKAYDVVSSLESTVIINVREYTIYLYEMRKNMAQMLSNTLGQHQANGGESILRIL